MTKIDISIIKKYTSYGINTAPRIEYDYFYYVDDTPLIGKNGIGESFHMGGTSSTFEWAKEDSTTSKFYLVQINGMFTGWEFGSIDLIDNIIEDEYGLLPILTQHYIPHKILPEFTEQIDKVCGDYMMNYEKIRGSAFTEMVCCLQMALIKSSNDDSGLRERIKAIVDEMSEKEEKEHKNEMR